MKIIWINHASFIFEYKNINLICDPWIEGTAFNDGWELLAETKFSYEDFSKVTHIWFSHEHPDHFSPPNLKKIKKRYRSQITVLYQKTKDKKVINFCKKLGFNVIEIPNSRSINILDDLILTCKKFGSEDSWLKIETPQFSILNLNDCPVRDKKDLLKLKENVKDIDLLLTQFSYANWCGNIEDKNQRLDEARWYIEKMIDQINYLNPVSVIPFASYIYFCHEENFSHNDSLNRISKVYNIINNKTNSDCIVLFPDDVYKINEDFNSENSIKKYEELYDNLHNREKLKSVLVSKENLKSASNDYVNKIKRKNILFPLKFLKMIGYLRPAKIYIMEYKEVIEFSFLSGLKKSKSIRNEAHIEMSSSNFYYCLNNLWGTGTLAINGRFQEGKKNSIKYFNRNFALGSENNFGRFFPRDIFVKYLRHQLKKLGIIRYGSTGY